MWSLVEEDRNESRLLRGSWNGGWRAEVAAAEICQCSSSFVAASVGPSATEAVAGVEEAAAGVEETVAYVVEVAAADVEVAVADVAMVVVFGVDVVAAGVDAVVFGVDATVAGVERPGRGVGVAGCSVCWWEGVRRKTGEGAAYGAGTAPRAPGGEWAGFD